MKQASDNEHKVIYSLTCLLRVFFGLLFVANSNPLQTGVYNSATASKTRQATILVRKW
jgi:hypothetical protein